MIPVEPLTLLSFIPAALALNLTPGADMMFCLGQGLRSGPRAAMAANIGIAVGGMVQVTLAGLGLGALVQAHPMAFDAIRWAGVAYLLVLAVQTLRSGPATASHTAPASAAKVFRQALMVNLLNPKVILFILAFLPQFVEPSRPVLPQFLTLGIVFAIGGLAVNGFVGVMAGSIGQRMAESRSLTLWLSRASAAIFAGLALRLALLTRG
jgi:threonine/homoserine/homoserine lactone efflux protein